MIGLSKFLKSSEYIDFDAENIQDCSKELFGNTDDEIEKARRAYCFVRDDIPHSFDVETDIITARASDVLRYQTGICHAKANLLAALLRAEGIPAGLCFQYLTLADDDSLGHCLHCYNAVYLKGRWIKVDARGNKAGIQAEFSLAEPNLAFYPRSEYGEYFIEGIYSAPHQATMEVLVKAKRLQDILDHIPDRIIDTPDILV